MILIKASILEFVNMVKSSGKNIVLFGSGAVCKTFIPYLDRQHEIGEKILFVIDNNVAKQGSNVDINGRQIGVTSLMNIKKASNFCVLITNGDFFSVVEQLSEVKELNDVECYILPIMQLERKYSDINVIYKTFTEPIIPRIIHYCWFSGNKMPYELERCIDSWKNMCPGYDIVRWDESNYDILKSEYTSGAYEKKKWGFIPDYARLDILYEYGGFYFDTDVEILKNLEPLRYQKAFCGRERVGHVNFGGGSGCEKNNPVIKEILEFRKDEKFVLSDGRLNTEASGFYETMPLMKRGLVLEDINQELDGINVYASEFFSPYNYINGDNIQSENTFSVHYFKGSWIENGNYLREQTRRNYSSFLRKLEDRK